MAMAQSSTRRRMMPILVGAGLAFLAVTAVTIWMLLQPSSLISAVAVPLAVSSPPGPVATVNGVAITQAMVDREVRTSRFNLVEPSPPLKDADLVRAGEEALNQLITRQLILQAAAQQEFSLNEAMIQQRVDLLYGAYGDDVLDESLGQSGVSRDDLSWWVSELTTVEEFTVNVIMANTAPENRQRVYNDWLNEQQGSATITTFDADQTVAFNALPGNPAPNFTLTTTNGQTISLADYQGQIVLVNFWATWCPSCIAEMPDYEAVYQQQPAGQFMVLGINLQENADHVQQFAQGLGLNFPILLDQDGHVTIRDYQIVGMPGSLIINRDGTIFYRHIGPMSGELLAEKLAELN